MNAQTRRDLQDTRRYLIERGWWANGAPFDPLGAKCAGNALRHVVLADSGYASLSAASQEIGDRYTRALRALGFQWPWELFHWNDAQPSVEPVIALFDRVLAESAEPAVLEREAVRA